jgi:hypothetical protein
MDEGLHMTNVARLTLLIGAVSLLALGACAKKPDAGAPASADAAASTDMSAAPASGG